MADFRFPGGTSTAIAEEIALQAKLGYRTGLVHRRSPILKKKRAFHPAIRSCIERGEAELAEVSPNGLVRNSLNVGLLLFHHPFVFIEPIQELPKIEAEHTYVVVHQPPYSADGHAYYDVHSVKTVLVEAIGGDVLWAPISTLVRRQFIERKLDVKLAPNDWVNVIDPERWQVARPRQAGERLVVGRHSRPDWQKWPDTRAEVLLTLPSSPTFDVRILGGGEFLRERFAPIPASWTVLEFGEMSVRDFLRELDVYVYHHHSSWIEAFGRTILEAMASGLPTVLGPQHEPVFGDGAIYAEPERVLGLLESLAGDPGARLHLGERAREAVAHEFGPQRHRERLQALIGGPAKRARRAVTGRETVKERVLMMSSNGIGVGHLTRLLAIARRLPQPLTPVFLTFSQARAVVERYGYLGEYLPFHRYLECAPELWNQHLVHDLDVILDFYRPRAVVFDGNVPYAGLLEARRRWPQIRFVWVRRSMWSRHAEAKLLERQSSFDLVIEPRDVAESRDRGPTVRMRHRAERVDPVLLLDDRDMLPRREARRSLGLSSTALCILVQLGSGNNFDIAPIVEKVHEVTKSKRRTEVVVVEWMMTERPLDPLPGMTLVHDFPAAKYLNAFDTAISAAGYNSFHELVASTIPTLFVPNIDPSMDHQLGRAAFAQSKGAALLLDPRDTDEFAHAFERLVDPSARKSMRARLQRLSFENGAPQAARLVAELALQ